MTRSCALPVPGACAWSTASRSPDVGHPQRPIVDGDATSAAIAAASIVAKVTRDRFMHRADALHPGLGVRRPRRLLDARAPRRDPAPRRLAAAPAVVPERPRTNSSRSERAARRATHSTNAPRGARGAQAPRASMITPIASKRSAAVCGRSRGSVQIGDRHGRGAPALAPRSPSKARTRRRRRVLTSTKTSASPSRTIRSISPKRVRWLRVTSAQPRRSRCASARSSPRRPRLMTQVVDMATTLRAITCHGTRLVTIQRAICPAAGPPQRRRRIVTNARFPCDERAPSVAAVLARVTTFAIDGLDPRRVAVEVDVRAGLPAFRSSASPTRPSARRVSGCGRRSSTPASSSRCGGSRSTSRRPPAQERARLRPGDRVRDPRGQRAGAGRRAGAAGGLRRAGARRRAARRAAARSLPPRARVRARARPASSSRASAPGGGARRGARGRRRSRRSREVAARAARRRAPRRRPAPALLARAAGRDGPTWPTCADSRADRARSRSRRPAATTCCSAARRAAARRCSRGGCRRSCRR